MPRLVCLLLLAVPTVSLQAAEPIDFAHQIVPVLREHCGRCHTGDQKKGGLSFNTRADLLAGGESGPAVVVGSGRESELIARLATDDPDVRMPPEGARVPAEQAALLRRWIDEGLKWDEGFAFRASAYEPPLKPRHVELPVALDGRTNPIDRILDAYLAERKLLQPPPMDDAAFIRRAHLDLVGLLPTPGETAKFVADDFADKRSRLVRRLLDDDTAYAEHWLTFWNDLLRNDYAGTGFITGGRKQISRWLYNALVSNLPYDEFARQLIAPPTPDSAGFGAGIRWRGDVSAGQTVEIQFAQSVGQTFLGINLKCASCHDSFIDRWTLDESYGLAAVYATGPLEIHRCDQPIGRQAQASWLFSELGQVDARASQPERLTQLAALLTSPENGRFTRTIVNRLWHRLMGRGIVHPVDAMQTEPWSADLLDYLAEDFSRHGYDLKHTLELIATSHAYQSRAQAATDEAEEAGYVYAGPRAKRLTAEQFVDAVWQISGAAPKSFDAPILRGRVDREAAAREPLTASWITAAADPAKTYSFRIVPKFAAPPGQTIAALASDGDVVLWMFGKQVTTYTPGQPIKPVVLTSHWRVGNNAMLFVVTPRDPANPPRLFFEARVQHAEGTVERIASNDAWQWTTEKPDAKGRVGRATEANPDGGDVEWRSAIVADPPADDGALRARLHDAVMQGSADADAMVRAALLKSDFLMRSLGRPNREQIVSMRPAALTTLEAIDLSNGPVLAEALSRGATRLAAEFGSRPDELSDYVFEFALSRRPTTDERAAVRALLGEQPFAQAIEDLLWAVVLLPEFMLVR